MSRITNLLSSSFLCFSWTKKFAFPNKDWYCHSLFFSTTDMKESWEWVCCNQLAEKSISYDISSNPPACAWLRLLTSQIESWINICYEWCVNYSNQFLVFQLIIFLCGYIQAHDVFCSRFIISQFFSEEHIISCY